MFIANSYKEFKHVNSTTLTIHINNTDKRVKKGAENQKIIKQNNLTIHRLMLIPVKRKKLLTPDNL